jgi:ribonuclease HI
MVEYEACILGLKLAIDQGAKHLQVFGDGLLVISQINGS